jgi:hypothetical protein
VSTQPHRRFTQIGFDRFIRLHWLERTARLVWAGSDTAALQSTLTEELRGSFRPRSAGVNGSLQKTIHILMKIWARPPRELHRLQWDGLELLSRLSRESQIAVHWGMAMAVYPFWGNVAGQVGRLLRLQGKVRVAEVRRRIVERYGERRSVQDAVRRVLRSMLDWGVLAYPAGRDARHSDGTYVPGLSVAVGQVELIAWLAEAVLHAHPDGMGTMRAVLGSPSLFPFDVSPISAAHLAAVSEWLDVERHGLDQDFLALRPVSIPTTKQSRPRASAR